MLRSEELLWIILMVPFASFASDKTHPEFLREKHAGTRSFMSTEDVAGLYPKLLQATSTCWTGETAPQTPAGTGGGAVGGAAAVVAVASRSAVGEIDDNQRRASIMVRARGAMGLLQSNFLQIDLEQDPAGTRITAFHRNNVKAQREFMGEVGAWLAGDWTFCEPKPFVRRP